MGLLFLRTICKYHDMASVEKLYWGYPSINGACRCLHECDHITFTTFAAFYNVCNFLVDMSTFTQAIKLVFRHKFRKKTVQNKQVRIHFLKKSCDQIEKSLTNFIYQKVP